MVLLLFKFHVGCLPLAVSCEMVTAFLALVDEP